jgi:hypothetical protein
VKSRKQRAGPDLKRSLGDLLNAPGDAQPMEFVVADCLEDEQVQSTLENIRLISLHPPRSY